MAASASASDYTFDYFPLHDSKVDDDTLQTPYRDEAIVGDYSQGGLSERLLFDEGDLSPVMARESSSSSHVRGRVRPKLNGLNYLNVVTYAAHLFVSWGVGVWGLDGIVDTRVSIGMRFETLVTPATWTYIIWYPILVLEGIFAIAQLLPDYRARPIVQDGTGFYFFYCFILQTCWTLFYSFELFIPSFVSVVAVLASLLSLLASQHNSQTRARRSPWEYYLFRFPFLLHAAWMVVATLTHFSLLFRSHHTDIAVQIGVDIVCLALLVPVALLSMACPTWKDFCFPMVILWTFIGILCQLEHPSDAMLDMFGELIIRALRVVLYFFIGTVCCSVIPNLVIYLSREWCTINVVELE
jgi:benzodiazapine receptor